MALLIPVLALYLAIGVHELGHLCAGWMAGFEFSRVSIGPIFLSRVGKQLKAGFHRSFLNGRVMMFPRSLNQLRWRFLIFIAGGPLANFVGFLWLVWIAASVSSVSAGTELLFTLSAWISLILGVSNLFPFETNDLVSDGGRIGMLLSKDGRKERWFALTAIENALRNLQRVKEWPAVLIRDATAVNDCSTDSVRASYYAFIWASILNRTEDVAHFLEQCLRNLDKAPSGLREIILGEAAIFQAWHRKNLDLALKWIQRLGKKSRAPFMDLRLDIVLLWAEGKTTDAMVKWEEALKQIRTIPDPKLREFLEQAWLEWKQEMDTRLAAEQAPV